MFTKHRNKERSSTKSKTIKLILICASSNHTAEKPIEMHKNIWIEEKLILLYIM